MKIRNFIKSSNFLLLNGDAIFDFNLKKIFADHIKSKNRFVTFLGTYAKLPYGTILVKKGIVHSFNRDITYDTVTKSFKGKKNLHFIIDRFGDSLYNHQDLMQKCKYSHKYKIPWTGIDTMCVKSPVVSV